MKGPDAQYTRMEDDRRDNELEIVQKMSLENSINDNDFKTPYLLAAKVF